MSTQTIKTNSSNKKITDSTKHSIVNDGIDNYAMPSDAMLITPSVFNRTFINYAFTKPKSKGV